jgi:NADH-quinone oxidoreductase subunit C
MAEPTLSLAEKLKAQLGEKALLVVESNNETTLEVAAADFATVALMLRDTQEFHFDCLIDVCGVDYLSYGDDEWETADVSSEGFSRGVDGEGVGRFTWASRPQGLGPDNRYAAVAHLLSIKHNKRLRLRCFASDNSLPIVPSLVNVYPVANWFEREAFDLFGIVFEGHPDLRRILTDYGFVGHPFRKDFPLIGNVEVRYDEEKKRVIYEPVSIDPRVGVPRVIREDSRWQQAATEQTAQVKK